MADFNIGSGKSRAGEGGTGYSYSLYIYGRPPLVRGIFRDDSDRENFLERLSILVPETQTICYAWGYLDPIMRIIEKVENRVMEIFGLERDVLYSKGRCKIQVAARSLLCY